MDQMGDFVRTMHRHPACSLLSTAAWPWRRRSNGCWTTSASSFQSHARRPSPATPSIPIACSWPGTCRVRKPCALPQRRRLQHQGTRPALVSAGLLPVAREVRQPSRAGRCPGIDRGVAVLPGGRFRPAARVPTARRPRRSPAPPGRPDRRVSCDRGPGRTRTDFRRPDRGRYTSRCATAVSRPTLRMVGVAQLVEPLVVVQDVAGSSPVTHPRIRAARAGSPTIEAHAVEPATMDAMSTVVVTRSPAGVPISPAPSRIRWAGRRRGCARPLGPG